MNNITQETKRQSYEQILDKVGDRQQQCIKGLQVLNEATANELAMYLYNNGTTPIFSRNYVHPRLHELVEQGLIKVVGKKKDALTDRTCAIYAIAELTSDGKGC